MQQPTKRQLVTTLSVLYLLALTILAASTLQQTRAYYLPIPNLLAALAIALPPLAGLALEAQLSLQNGRRSKQRSITNGTQTQRNTQPSIAVAVMHALFLIAETAIATLAGTHLSPAEGLKCGLEARWQALYSAKDATAVQKLQDAMACCGFNSVKDRAFPFSTDAGKCAARYERTVRCLEPWMAVERKVAGIVLGVVGGVVAWQLAILLVHRLTPISFSQASGSWLPSTVRLPPGEGPARPQAAIGYRDLEETGEDDSLRDEVGRLNNDSNLASRVEGGRRMTARSPLIQETENHWGSD